MPNLATARKRRPRNNRRTMQPKLALVPMPAKKPVEEKPVRGVKLKTVSMFTLIFALLCVAAFAAGRPPVAAEGTRIEKHAKKTVHVSRNVNHRTPRMTHGARVVTGE